MDISFPMPLLLPFSCTEEAIWGSPTEPVYKRTLQNKDSHGQNFAGQFSIFTSKSWEENKYSEIASWDSSDGSGNWQGRISWLSRCVVATEKASGFQTEA